LAAAAAALERNSELVDQLAQLTASPYTPCVPDHILKQCIELIVTARSDTLASSRRSSNRDDGGKQGPEQADDIEAPAGAVIATLHCYKEGIAPDYTALFGDLDGVQVECLELIDPHAMSSVDACMALSQIICRMSRFAKKIEKIILIFKLDKKHINEKRYYRIQKIHRNLHRIKTTLAHISHKYNFPCPNIEYRELNKTKDQDFHDRFIKIRFKRDGAVFDREYLCVRGLDAFVRHEFFARIVVKPDVEVIQNTDS